MKTKRNLLIVSPSKAGLTETFIRAHIEQLNGKVFYLYGWDLNYKTEDDISLKDLYSSKPKFLDKLKSLLPHFIYFRLEQKRKKELKKEALIKRYIKENQIDLVLAEYGTAGSFIAPVCVELEIPYIVHFHGIDASSFDILKQFQEGYNYMFKHAFKIIVVSKAMAKALENKSCPSDKLVVNPCGPHPDFLNITADYQSNYLIAVGRHTYKKAPYLTILAFHKALQEYPDLKLKMIGTGELFGVSQNLIKSLGLDNQIELLGGLDRPEIIKHLKNASMFLQHSLVAYNGDSEGTPVGIMEAMAAGLPVISTKHAGIPDVVIQDETGFLCNEGDIDAMSTHILSINENRNLAQTMGRKGKERVKTHFTLEKHISIINTEVDKALDV